MTVVRKVVKKPTPRQPVVIAPAAVAPLVGAPVAASTDPTPPPPEKKNFWRRLRDLVTKPKTPDEPATPEPTPPPPGAVPYLRVWMLLRKINFRAVWPVLLGVPVLVFFAVSGLVAWGLLALKFIWTMWSIVP